MKHYEEQSAKIARLEAELVRLKAQIEMLSRSKTVIVHMPVVEKPKHSEPVVTRVVDIVDLTPKRK